MPSVQFNLELNQVYETYNKEEYDRTNDDLPTLLLQSNAMNFGGKYYYDLMIVYNEIINYRKTLNIVKRVQM